MLPMITTTLAEMGYLVVLWNRLDQWWMRAFKIVMASSPAASVLYERSGYDDSGKRDMVVRAAEAIWSPGSDALRTLTTLRNRARELAESRDRFFGADNLAVMDGQDGMAHLIFAPTRGKPRVEHDSVRVILEWRLREMRELVRDTEAFVIGITPAGISPQPSDAVVAGIERALGSEAAIETRLGNGA